MAAIASLGMLNSPFYLQQNILNESLNIDKLLAQELISEEDLNKHIQKLAGFKETAYHTPLFKKDITLALNHYSDNIKRLQLKFEESIEKTKRVSSSLVSNSSSPTSTDKPTLLLTYDPQYDDEGWKIVYKLPKKTKSQTYWKNCNIS